MHCQRIVVTGGAGYIGSHFCKNAFLKGHKTFIIDNLITGNYDFVKWGDFYKLDIREESSLRDLLLKIKELLRILTSNLFLSMLPLHKDDEQKMVALLIIGLSLFYDIDMKNYILEL